MSAKRIDHFISGQRVAGASGRQQSVTNPATGAVTGQVALASSAEVARAVAFAFRELKLVVEPGGCVTLAALLAGKLDVQGTTVIATLSGGNIDAEVLVSCLQEAGAL